MTIFDMLRKAEVMVDAEIARRRPDMFGTVVKAYRQLGELADVAREIKKAVVLDGDTEPPAKFVVSVEEIIQSLSSFRSGYAFKNGDMTIATSKAADEISNADGAFAYFGDRFEGLVKEQDNNVALAGLRELKAVLSKALNWESTGGSAPSVTRDQWQSDKTSVTTAPANSGSNAPDSAKTNWSPDSPAPPAGSPSQANNGGDMSVLAVAAANTGQRDYLRKAAEAVEKSNEDTAEEWPDDMTRWLRRK